MRYLFTGIFLMIVQLISAQNNNIEKIIAVVGEEIILKSELENEYINAVREGYSSGEDLRTTLLEQMLIEKLLLAQAKIDTVTVTNEEVERQLNSSFEEFTRRAGSVETLEKIFGRSLEEEKAERRPMLKNSMIAGMMKEKITSHVRSTPSEVRLFYRKTNKDSLPDMPARYEIQQIVLKPRISDHEKERIRNRLRDFRESVNSGEQNFATLALMYSEDKETNIFGGATNYKLKSDFLPEFAEVAFSLKDARISKIVETEEGFHIIQFIDREGERINVRHILLRPRIEEEARTEAMSELDTIYNAIQDGIASFETIARIESMDKNSRNNGGLINVDGETKLTRDQIRGEMARQINRMEVGEISKPFVEKDEYSEEYKIIKFKAYYPAHKANLDDDWYIFENILHQQKAQQELEKWVKEKQESTYIHIDEEYKNANFVSDGWIK